MKYLISNTTPKEWNGKKFVEATLIDDTENQFVVAAWGGEFDNKTEWEGEIERNEKGYWKMKKAKLDKPNFIKAKEAIIEKAVARKEQSISKFQDNREWSIKVASTINKAVDLAIAEIKDITTLNTLEEDILKWRKWLWNNWLVNPDDIDPLTDKFL